MTEAEMTPATVKQPGRGLRIALAVSVAINLAVAGIVAGAAFHGGGPMGARGAVRDLGFGAYTEALSREDRTALRQAYMAKSPNLRATRNQMRRDVADVLAALRASPFDADRLAVAMDVQGKRMSDQFVTGQQLMQEFFAKMTPEARAQFADRLEAGLGRGKKP